LKSKTPERAGEEGTWEKKKGPRHSAVKERGEILHPIVGIRGKKERGAGGKKKEAETEGGFPPEEKFEKGREVEQDLLLFLLTLLLNTPEEDQKSTHHRSPLFPLRQIAKRRKGSREKKKGMRSRP